MSGLFNKIRRLHLRLQHQANGLLAGAYHSAFKGQGIEFEEVREYLPGDDVRTIDWNVTARLNKPFVKRFKEERELTLMLVVDGSASTHFGEKKERIAEIGGLLAFSAIRNQDRVGLILFTDQVEHYIPPRKGLRHILRIIRDLLTFTPHHKTTSIETALHFIGRVVPRRSLCVLLSDFLDPSLPDQKPAVALRNKLIGIEVYDPMERHFPKGGLLLTRDLEQEHETLVESHSLHFAPPQPIPGIDWISISTTEDPVYPLQKYLNSR